MNTVVTPAGTRGAGDSAPRQTSRLLPSLFEGIRPNRRLTVLDVGPAAPETIRFFSRYRCRLHIRNLFEEKLVREQQDELDDAELKKAFSDLLALPRGNLVDICLFWDFPNYLTSRSLRALGSALRPYLHEGSRAHGFSVLNVNTPLGNRRYGISGEDTLSSRPARLEQLAYYPHTHEDLNESLGAFAIERGWLLADGRLEMLLQSRV